MQRIYLLLGFVLLSASGWSQDRKPHLEIGDDAPEFQVAYWLKNTTGAHLQKGTVTVVEFWATWCGPCLANVPHLSHVAEEYKSKNVQVFGIDGSERKGVGLDSLKRFIIGEKGGQMHYMVGADDSTKFMATHWLKAAGTGSIPFAIVVDGNGKIAWYGHPLLIDKPLEQIVDGKWDIPVVKKTFLENKRLDSIDMSIIPEFNTYLGAKKYKEGLEAADSLVRREPNLKYRNYTAHYTFVCLLMIKPEDAVAFAREAWAHNDFPNWKGVSDMVAYSRMKNISLPSSAYELGTAALKEQLDHYPGAMDFPATYDEMASDEYAAGNTGKAIAYEHKALDLAKETTTHTRVDVKKLNENLAKYQNAK